MTDYSRLAGYIRNKITAGEPCTFKLKQARIFIVPSQAFGHDLPGILVASERGGSIYLEPHMPFNATTFVAGGFKLTLARELDRLFVALKASFKLIA